jgi:hypothetical protein
MRISMEPRVVATINGIRLYWCPAKSHQILEELCKEILYRTGRKTACRLCHGTARKAWAEPQAGWSMIIVCDWCNKSWEPKNPWNRWT